MVQSTRWIVFIVAVLSLLSTVAEAGEPEAMLGVTVGTTSIKGASSPELGGSMQSLTLGIDVMWFHSSWFMLAGDFSKALNNESNYSESSGSSYTQEGSAWYADLLAGARYVTGSGSFMYLAAGATMAGGNYNLSRTSRIENTETFNLDISSALGFVSGGGVVLRASESVLVFIRLRHRLVIADSDITRTDDDRILQADFDLGGLETAVGVGFTL
jgi:opacity protein-like surface antigen